MFDACSGARVATLADASCVVKAVAFSADGSRLAATSYDGCVRVYAVGDFRPLETLFAQNLWNRSLAFTEAGLLTGSFGGGPVLLGPRGVTRFGPEKTSGLNGFAVSPSGAQAVVSMVGRTEISVVCCDDGVLYEHDLVRREPIRALGAHQGAVLCAAYSPDGRRVASGSWDHTVRVWDRSTGELAGLFPGLGEPINALCWSAEGTHLWLGTFNGEVGKLTPATGELCLVEAHDGSVKSLARSGERVASVGRDGRVRLFGPNLDAGFRAGDSILNGVALAEKGTRLATVSRRNGVELWSDAGEPLASYRAHPCSAKTVAFSPDETMVAAGYYDGTLALWSPDSGLAHLERVSEASISQVAFHGRELLVSTWDARGTLAFVDPRRGVVARIPVSA